MSSMNSLSFPFATSADVSLPCMIISRPSTTRHTLHSVPYRTGRQVSRRCYLDRNPIIDRLAFTAAHDIKAPLYTIFSMIESMRKKMNSENAPVQEVITDNLNFLFKEADRLNHMIEDLLQLSTLNQHLPKPTKVNMNWSIR